MQSGIKAILSDPSAFNILVLSLDYCVPSDKRVILEILAGMCYLDRPAGHDKVLKGSDTHKCTVLGHQDRR